MWIVTKAFCRRVIQLPDQIPAILLTNFDFKDAPKLAFDAYKCDLAIDKTCLHRRCHRAGCQCYRQ